MRLTPKFYALTLIAVCFISLAVVVAANVLIDPQRMFGLELFPNKRNENLRYAQYLAYRKVEPSIGGLMFASSRGSGIPLDVLSARTGGVRYADFTVGAGMITDHLPVLERAIRDKAARGERLKQVFLLLDVDLLGERPTTNRNPQTQLHPDLTGEDPVRFWVRYLTAIQFRAWRDDVRRASLPKGADLDEPVIVEPPLPRIRVATLGPLPLPIPKEPMRVTARPDYQRQLATDPPLRRTVPRAWRQSDHRNVADPPHHAVVCRHQRPHGRRGRRERDRAAMGFRQPGLAERPARPVGGSQPFHRRGRAHDDRADRHRRAATRRPAVRRASASGRAVGHWPIGSVRPRCQHPRDRNVWSIDEEAQPPAARLEMLNLPDQVLHVGRRGFGFNTRQTGVMQFGFYGFEIDHQILQRASPTELACPLYLSRFVLQMFLLRERW